MNDASPSKCRYSALIDYLVDALVLEILTSGDTAGERGAEVQQANANEGQVPATDDALPSKGIVALSRAA